MGVTGIHGSPVAYHSNEIVMGPGAAERFKTSIDSTWTAKRNGVEKDYLVTGMASSIVNAGIFVILTREAYEDLVPDASMNDIGVFTTTSSDSSAVTKALQKELGSSFQVFNSREATALQIGSYMSVVPLLSRSLMAFTGLIVVLVVALMTSLKKACQLMII